MNDRELLELAAKAAGMRLHVWGTKGAENFADLDAHQGGRWNPLSDDGDALRLAVKLHISIEHPDPADLGGGYVNASICRHRYRYRPLNKYSFCVVAGSEEFPGDLLSATRQAIVLAAAEIGKLPNPR